jgi:hypothetical protein
MQAAAAAVKKIIMTNPITLGIAGGTGAVRFVAAVVVVLVLFSSLFIKNETLECS